MESLPATRAGAQRQRHEAPTPKQVLTTSARFSSRVNDDHPNAQVFHLQVHHRPQPLRRGHHGGGRRNLQTAALPQAGGPGRSDDKPNLDRAAARHRLQHPRRQHAGRLRRPMERGPRRPPAKAQDLRPCPLHRSRTKKPQDVDQAVQPVPPAADELGGTVTRRRQGEPSRQRPALAEELDRYLAGDYGIEPTNEAGGV